MREINYLQTRDGEGIWAETHFRITPRVLTDAFAAGGGEAKRAFQAMMTMKKIDIADKFDGSRFANESVDCEWMRKQNG